MLYKSVKEFSSVWNIEETQITYFCRTGKIPGCKKEGKQWMIPENATIPKSVRTTHSSNTIRLPLPIGLSDYKDMAQNYYYIDKTLMIKDIIDTLPKVSLFTRPRRFGKTLNMDMLKVFFEKTEEDTSIYFKDKQIWACGKKYQDYQGKYPVIFLTFKDVKFDSFDEAVNKIRSLIQDEYLRHYGLLKSNLNDIDLIYYQKILDDSASIVDLTSSLAKLSKYLYDATKVKAIIIIDEYDTPISQGYIKGYYENIISLMRNLFSGAFKDNSYLSFGFMTGILRVAKESIFSGMNNLIENSILTDRFSEYFGFTKNEVKNILSYYKVNNKFSEVCDWYDGYKFGNTEIFNPWSVLSYINNNCKANAYWQSTGKNDIIKQIVSENSSDVKSSLQTLLTGETIVVDIDSSVIYPEIRNNPFTVFSFLTIAGYLKIVNVIDTPNSKTLCEVRIPNKEISCIYGNEILASLNDTKIQSSALVIQNAIIKQNTVLLKEELQKFLMQSVSVYDTGSESFFQGLMIGIYATMNNLYNVQSNKESGIGRFDIQMYPLNSKNNKTGILIELKVLTNPKSQDNETIRQELIELSKTALCQIDSKHYHQNLIDLGMTTILKYGIAFYKKFAEISFTEEIVH